MRGLVPVRQIEVFAKGVRVLQSGAAGISTLGWVMLESASAEMHHADFR